jgi:L-ascorbate metabolism protein UlaG (beta-lactamase superfamily)
VLIDPFLSGNPSAKIKPEDLTGIDMVLVTHGHGDHLGDAVRIAKDNNAVLVAMHEIALYGKANGVASIEPMNIGGTVEVQGVSITMTNAVHSSDFEGGSAHAAGFVIAMDGHTVYHAGDTGVFYDMNLIRELYAPEVALLPIGSRYTMGIKEAVKAVEFLQPQIVVPMHFGTTPLIQQDPEEFKKAVKGRAHVVVLNPGDSFTL